MIVLLDTQWFTVYESEDRMTYKVKSKEKSWRSKTFKGETAWSDCQRYVNDNINGDDNYDVEYVQL